MGQVERNSENLKKCSCMKCPSYKLGCKLKAMPKNMMVMMKGSIAKVDHFEGLFCTFGTSTCIKKVTECICETCDVYKDYKLTNYAYCTVEGGKQSHIS